ncbi:hypothetical protein L596_018224 [Steinernema carpocapsae]|uniref:Uncharacterized protein n=1 Tax=Steinernema carpocapsae TaxID=34508 RepID=A0A4U5N507_STECR|nr:hypothetical protein L596_018224 [Steinernema carpocapsae]
MGGDEVAVDKTLEDMARNVGAIGRYVVDWVGTVQTLAWPEVSLEAVKRNISLTHITTSSLNKTANDLVAELSKYGHESWRYEVIITEASKDKSSWSVKITDPQNHAVLSGFNGVDVHVLRYDESALERADNATMWFEENESVMEQFLRRGVSTDSSEELFSELQENIKSSTPTASTQQFY